VTKFTMLLMILCKCPLAPPPFCFYASHPSPHFVCNPTTTAGVYEELLAVPVTKGVKSEAEKFAGALYTTTVEVRGVSRV
jgi:hypothetical protein